MNMEQLSILSILEGLEKDFTLQDAYSVVMKKKCVKKPSIRARIYEAINDGKLKRISTGVYSKNDIVVINGDGRDISFIENNSVSAIITDHPYDLFMNKGGNRNFAGTYDCFNYNQFDFDEKYRVLKDGCFLVEFLPEESGDNWKYLAKIKEMAEKSGFKYYAKVPWKKGSFISNCGRKSKNTEDVLIFSKGDARCLRVDAKKDKKEPEKKHFMKGTNGILPTVFDYEKVSKNLAIHQAEKPVALLEAIINFISLEGEIILDQFAGSGVTGEAAYKQKRQCILIEKSKEYYEKIIQRINLFLQS